MDRLKYAFFRNSALHEAPFQPTEEHPNRSMFPPPHLMSKSGIALSMRQLKNNMEASAKDEKTLANKLEGTGASLRQRAELIQLSQATAELRRDYETVLKLYHKVMKKERVERGKVEEERKQRIARQRWKKVQNVVQATAAFRRASQDPTFLSQKDVLPEVNVSVLKHKPDSAADSAKSTAQPLPSINF